VGDVCERGAHQGLIALRYIFAVSQIPQGPKQPLNMDSFTWAAVVRAESARHCGLKFWRFATLEGMSFGLLDVMLLLDEGGYVRSCMTLL